MATMIGEPPSKMLANGTTTGDGVVLAEIALAAATPQPAEPPPDVPVFHTNTFDHYVARQMHPLYQEEVRQRWGPQMASMGVR